MTPIAPNQIWLDNAYYRNADTGAWMPKYVLVMATEPKHDCSVTAVFTSKPNGLGTDPACSMSHPRTGYYVGAPGGVLYKETWVDFATVAETDNDLIRKAEKAGRMTLTQQTLDAIAFCAVLRCALGLQDLSNRNWRWINDTAALLGQRR